MEALRAISNNINTFVGFFDAINRLFCQIRWLEQNINNSSAKLLLLVLLIVVFCVFVFLQPSSGGGPFDAITRALNDYGPIVLVVAVVLYFVSRRFSGAADAEGTEGNATLDSVLFGRPRGGDGGGRDGRGYEPVAARNADDDVERPGSQAVVHAVPAHWVHDGAPVPSAPPHPTSKQRRGSPTTSTHPQ
jgi:hypothetical protein